MAAPMIRYPEPFYGLRAHTSNAALSILRRALSGCPGAVTAQGESVLEVTVTTPHLLQSSETLTAMIRVATEPDPRGRQQAAREERKRIRQNWLLSSAQRVRISALVTQAADQDLLSWTESGLVFHLGRLSSPQLRVLLLGELYTCLQPEDAPPIYWPVGQPFEAGKGVEIGQPLKYLDHSVLAAMQSAERWLSGIKATASLFIPENKTSIGRSLAAGVEADTVLLWLLEDTGSVVLSPSRNQITLRGGRDLMPMYLNRRTMADRGLKHCKHWVRPFPILADHLVEAKEAFARREGADLRIDLDQIPDFTADADLKPLGTCAQLAGRTIALAELYRLIRKQPDPTYLQVDPCLTVWIGWPAAQVRSIADLTALCDRWEAITGWDMVFFG